jgi:hypothetical protein
MAKQVAHSPDLAELQSLEGWALLDPDERETIVSETEALTRALHQEGQSKLSIGAHLAVVRDILQPKRGMWMEFLRKNFHMSPASAYRYIEDHDSVSKSLPANVMSIAMSRGYKIKPQAITKNPPPKTTDTKEIIHYLDKLVRPPKSKVVVVEALDTDLMLKECLNFCKTRFARVPSGRAKTNFTRALLGMLLTTFGMSDQTLAPVAVPAFFAAKRGRPLGSRKAA